MKFGLMFSFEAPEEFGTTPVQVYKESLEQVQYAEELGYDSVWVTEHHFTPNGYCPSPLIAGAAMASRTQRIKVGQCILLLPLYGHPLRLAEDVAVLDVLSEGRAILGIGAGYRQQEFAGFGVPIDKRKVIMDEGLEIVLRAWTEERFSYRGKYYSLEDAAVTPKPVQRPHPPLWVGTPSRAGKRRAARLGLPFLHSLGPLNRIKEDFEEYRQMLATYGHDPSGVEMGFIRSVYITEEFGQAWDDVRPHFIYQRTVTYGGPGSAQFNDPSVSSREGQHGRWIFGDPEFCIEELEHCQSELQPSLIILNMQLPGMEHRKVMASMELFAKQVMPRFKG